MGKERLLNNINDPNFAGWGYYFPDNYTEADDLTCYEFRIALDMDPENLKLAYPILIDVLSKHQLYFKVFVIDQTNRTKWDLTLFDNSSYKSERDFLLHTALDRNQCGKEVCVYFRPQRDSSDPEVWKQIMLECWQALAQNKKIKFGYVDVPQGDAPIHTENGIVAPLTFTQGFGWQQRHGILFGKPSEVRNQVPFHNISITHQDISKKSLEASVEKIKAERETHYLQVKKPQLATSFGHIKRIIDQIDNQNVDNRIFQRLNKVLSLNDQLRNLKYKNQDELEQLRSNLKDVRTELEMIFPYVADYDEELYGTGFNSGSELKLNPFFSGFFDKYNQLIDLLQKTQFDSADKLITTIEEHYNNMYLLCIVEMEHTLDDFYSYPLTKAWLEAEGYTKDVIAAKINVEPLMMQCLFRKLVHCTREQQTVDYYSARKEVKETLEVINNALSENSSNLDEKQSEALKKLVSHATQLLDQAEELKKKTTITELHTITEMLTKTNAALRNPTEDNIAALQSMADTAAGKPSPLWRAVGITLGIIGGLVLLAASAILIATTFGGAAVPVIAGVALTGKVLAGTAAGAALLTTIGVGIFANGNKRSGMSDTLNNLSHDVNALSPDYYSTLAPKI